MSARHDAVGGLFAGDDENPDAYELLGDGIRGGEGTTWRALDRGLPASMVCAVKMMPRPESAPPDWPSKQDRLRWASQRKLLQHLDQPNIVRLHDVFEGAAPHPRGEAGRAEERVVYVTMEWIDGPTLRQELAGSHASPATLYQRLGYVSQLTDALVELMAMKANAALHRDVKPDNCIIDRQRGLVLIDVTGLRLVGDGVDIQGLITPGYAAPEAQAQPRRPRTAATEVRRPHLRVPKRDRTPRSRR